MSRMEQIYTGGQPENPANKSQEKKDRLIVAVLLAAAVLIAILPLIFVKGAEFSGTDDAGGEIIGQLDASYEPWMAPPLEMLLKGELPGEVESTLFCVQTGIGVGIIAFVMGRFVERRKWMRRADRNE